MIRRRATRHLKGTAGALLLAAAMVLGITAVLHARVEQAVEKPGRPPLPVELVTFETETAFIREQEFLGLVQAGTHTQIGFEISGTIDAITVREGGVVDRGAVLATLDTQTINARREASQARVEQIESELELARGRTARQAPLKDSGAISAQAYDDTRLGEKTIAARLAAAKAELRALDVELQKSTLRAPYDALVGRQLLDTGAVTGPGTPLFSLIARDNREAHIGIAVEQAQSIVPGDPYTLRWRGEPLPATLRSIRPDVNPVSMTTVAIFDLPEGTPAYDGEPVAVALPRRVEEIGGWLPLSALLEGERGIWTVLRVDAGTHSLTSVREVVQVLHVKGSNAFVRGTLNDGDQVIGDGVHRIAPGTAVRRVES